MYLFGKGGAILLGGISFLRLILALFVHFIKSPNK
jgi:hypothetical protein